MRVRYFIAVAASAYVAICGVAYAEDKVPDAGPVVPSASPPALPPPKVNGLAPENTPGASSASTPQTKNADPKSPPPQVGTSAVVMDLSAIDGVIGKSVKSSKGEDMGRVVDLLVTPAGQVRAAVIDFGGVLGVGSRKVAVDWKTLNFKNIGKNGAVELSLTHDEVRVAPEFKPGDAVVILEAPKAAAATAKSAPPASDAVPAPVSNDAAATPKPSAAESSGAPAPEETKK